MVSAACAQRDRCRAALSTVSRSNRRPACIEAVDQGHIADCSAGGGGGSGRRDKPSSSAPGNPPRRLGLGLDRGKGARGRPSAPPGPSVSPPERVPPSAQDIEADLPPAEIGRRRGGNPAASGLFIDGTSHATIWTRRALRHKGYLSAINHGNMAAPLHLIKLCVRGGQVADLVTWRRIAEYRASSRDRARPRDPDVAQARGRDPGRLRSMGVPRGSSSRASRSRSFEPQQGGRYRRCAILLDQA